MIAGLAFAGYKLTHHSKLDRVMLPPPVPGPTQEDLDVAPEALKERWQAARQPHRTGMVANKWIVEEPLPFFGSSSGSSTHEDLVKDMKLTLFTGQHTAGTAMPVGYRPRRAEVEVPQIWSPHETASRTALGQSGSAAGMPPGFSEDTASRLPVSRLQNNLHPLGAPQQVPPNNDPLLRAMPINPSVKMPGLLQGLTPVGFSTAHDPVQLAPAAQSDRAAWREGKTVKEVAVPVINHTAAPSAAAGTPLLSASAYTRATNSSSKPQSQEIRGAAFAPRLAGSQVLLTLAPRAELAVERSRPARSSQQAGDLAFGASRPSSFHPAAAGSSGSSPGWAARLGPQRAAAAAAVRGPSRALAPPRETERPLPQQTSAERLLRGTAAAAAPEGQGMTATFVNKRGAEEEQGTDAASSGQGGRQQLGPLQMGQSRAWTPGVDQGGPAASASSRSQQGQQHLQELAALPLGAARWLPASAQQPTTAASFVSRRVMPQSPVPQQRGATTGAQQASSPAAETLKLKDDDGPLATAAAGRMGLAKALVAAPAATAGQQHAWPRQQQQPTGTGFEFVVPTRTFAPSSDLPLLLSGRSQSQRESPGGFSLTAVPRVTAPNPDVQVQQQQQQQSINRKVPSLPALGTGPSSTSLPSPVPAADAAVSSQIGLRRQTEHQPDQSMLLINARSQVPQQASMQSPGVLSRRPEPVAAQLVPQARLHAAAPWQPNTTPSWNSAPDKREQQQRQPMPAAGAAAAALSGTQQQVAAAAATTVLPKRAL